MEPDNRDSSRKKINRRKFLKSEAMRGFAASVFLSGSSNILIHGKVGSDNRQSADKENTDSPAEEILYNGIKLSKPWPPQYMKPDCYDPMPVPYLLWQPEIIPIDTGRQLFVDDFLIEYTDLERKYHQPVKYEGNPILRPLTKSEHNEQFCPVAAPFSDGCFYDPKDKCFKLWYMSGWFDGTAMAISTDGIYWKRPDLDVVPGTNLVLAPHDDLRRDGASVWLDHESINPDERFKMYLYERQGKIGEKLNPVGGYLLTSPDGIHWNWGGKITGGSDNNTFYYNPFRKKWVFTIRKEGRPFPPWSNPLKTGNGRARSYWENDVFKAAMNKWDGAVFWFGADRLDTKRSRYEIGDEPQIYKVDAAGYESIMLGLIQVHYGPSNEVCAKGGFPKLTELQLAFSRDGFHWDRSCRQTFIEAHPDNKRSWERAYIHSVGGVCNIVGDNLHFYYTAFRGDESNRNSLQYWSGMYADASMGLAILRRDGFASMGCKKEGSLLTRLIKFSGKYLFVNVEAKRGSLTVEICGSDGKPLQGFTREDCLPIIEDSTKCLVKWKHSESFYELSGKEVRMKFYLNHSRIYAFWVSQNYNGTSGGATAAGGPGFSGYWDT
jgi:hypothetical protein